MAKKSKRIIDPLFSLPRGAEEEFSQAEIVRTTATPVSGVGTGDVPMVQVDFPEEQDTHYIGAPEVFYIIDQKLRRAPGGQQVVDIVLSVEDVIGANEYEVQIAKI